MRYPDLAYVVRHGKMTFYHALKLAGERTQLQENAALITSAGGALKRQTPGKVAPTPRPGQYRNHFRHQVNGLAEGRTGDAVQRPNRR